MNCPKCKEHMQEILYLAPIHCKSYYCQKCGLEDVELLEEITDEFTQRFNAIFKEIEKMGIK